MAKIRLLAYVGATGCVRTYVSAYCGEQSVPIGERTDRCVADLRAFGERLADTTGLAVELYVRLHNGPIVDSDVIYPAYVRV